MSATITTVVGFTAVDVTEIMDTEVVDEYAADASEEGAKMMTTMII
jgi:hypothetical protein